MPKLSAIIITLNEAANIEDCLRHLAFCDERIVVDCGSTDDTVALAKKEGAVVAHHAFEGFGAQKNYALSLATGDWVLSVDADERVTPALATEIAAAVATGKADGYHVPRLSSFCGREIWHSGWYPDYVLRLFRREKARFSDHLVHERVICDGRVLRLSNHLLHDTMPGLEDALIRINRYSSAGAKELAASGRRVSFMSGILHGWWRFMTHYVFRAGFLDGREGFLLAVAGAEGTYYRYMKAWLAQRQGK